MLRIAVRTVGAVVVLWATPLASIDATAQTPRDSAGMYAAALKAIDRSPPEIRAIVNRRLERLACRGCDSLSGVNHSKAVLDSVLARMPGLALCEWRSREGCPDRRGKWAVLATIRPLAPDRFDVEIRIFSDRWQEQYFVEVVRSDDGWTAVRARHTGST